MIWVLKLLSWSIFILADAPSWGRDDSLTEHEKMKTYNKISKEKAFEILQNFYQAKKKETLDAPMVKDFGALKFLEKHSSLPEESRSLTASSLSGNDILAASIARRHNPKQSTVDLFASLQSVNPSTSYWAFYWSDGLNSGTMIYVDKDNGTVAYIYKLNIEK